MEYRAVEESLMIDPGRRSGTSRRGVLVGAVMVAVVLTTRFAWSAIFTVDTTVDAHDATPGDGVCETTTGGGACSLRAAVEEANALAGHDQIDVPAGTYLFTVPYFGGPDTPPLMLSDDVDVIGAGAASTVVDGNCGFYGANGGVFRVRTPATASISGVTVRGGCESGCAGIYNDGTLSLRDAVLTDDVGQVGSITGGGGGLCNMGTATVVRTTVTNCTAGYGGGISNSGTLTLRESTVNGNAAETGGGIENTGDLTIVNSTIADNVAYGHYMRGGAFIGGWGGGILADGGTVRVTNSTVSHNSIDCGPEGCDGSGCSTTGVIGRGGGLSQGYDFADPSTPRAGVFELHSTILADNRQNDSPCSNCGKVILTSDGHNVDSDGSCHLFGPQDQSHVDPLLGPLTDNGGPTATRGLLAGSPAIDHGDSVDCPATDQRGVTRPEGPACDVGAYEVSLCGNGVLDAGEDCDDGSDCCSTRCTFAPAGTACTDDGNVCTADRCDGAGHCAHGDRPDDCRHSTRPRGGSLRLRTDPGDPDGRKNQLVWKWGKGESTSPSDLGDPVNGTTDYTLCLYDCPTCDVSLRLQVVAPAGGTCGGAGACWTSHGSDRVTYDDTAATPDGLTQIKVQAGEDGKAKAQVVGKGPNLHVPALPLTAPVTVQLHAGGGACWEGTFSAPTTTSPTAFKAKAD